MTRAVTLLELRTRALAAADMPQLSNANWAPTSEMNLMINASAAELHETLVMTFADYFLRTKLITFVANLETYPLPENFFKVRGVYALAVDGSRIPMQSFGEAERADLYAQGGFPQPTSYRIEDDNLIVLPVPQSGTLEFRYSPQVKYLANDTDTLSYNIVSGWDDFIVYDVATKLRVKGQMDPSTVMAMADRLRQRITRAGDERTVDGITKVRDAAGRRSSRRRCLP